MTCVCLSVPVGVGVGVALVTVGRLQLENPMQQLEGFEQSMLGLR